MDIFILSWGGLRDTDAALDENDQILKCILWFNNIYLVFFNSKSIKDYKKGKKKNNAQFHWQDNFYWWFIPDPHTF